MFGKIADAGGCCALTPFFFSALVSSLSIHTFEYAWDHFLQPPCSVSLRVCLFLNLFPFFFFPLNRVDRVDSGGLDKRTRVYSQGLWVS